MASYPLLWLPLAGLVVLVLSGAGLAATLGRRFPLDAQAALAAPVGAAVLVCAGPLVDLGLSAPLIGAVVVLGGFAFAVVKRRAVGLVLRAGLAPAVVVLVALFCAVAPLVPHAASGTPSLGNADPYLWVSEARAMLDGPAPAPASDYPDRRAYEYPGELHWTLGLPFGLAQLAALAGLDPELVYGAFAALVAVLLALAVYGSARACLAWTPKVAALASGVVSANALLLYATLNGWQAQLALTTFGVLAIFCLRLAFDERALARERVLAGLFVAAAVGAYGSLFGWFGVLLVVALGGFVATGGLARLRRAAVVTLGTATAAAMIGLPSLVQAINQLGVAAEAAGSSRWDHYAHGLPAEAIGLIPRIGTADRPPFLWSLLAFVAMAVLVVLAVRVRGLAAGERRDVLLSTGLFSLAAIALLNLPGPNPYVSIKIASYAAPLLTMLAVYGLIAGPLRPRARRAAVGAAGSLFAAASLVVGLQPFLNLRSSRTYASVQAAVAEVPADRRIAVGVDDTWGQLWLVYFLRDRPIRVLEPSEYLEGFGQTRGLNPSREPYDYLIEHGRSSDAIWEGDAFAALPNTRGRLHRTGLAWVHLRPVPRTALTTAEFVRPTRRVVATTASARR